MIKTVSGNHLQMRYVNIGPLPVMGLCNQLYYLVASTIWCYQNKVQLLFIDTFHLEPNSKFYCYISKILYLDAINEYIRPKYGVGLFDINLKHYKKYKSNQKFFSIKLNWDEVIAMVNTIEGNDILNNLLFIPELFTVPMKFINSKTDINKVGKLNIVHLRLEDDAILHWSSINKMKKEVFFNKLCEKYISLIEKHTTNNEPLIFLTGNVNNPVINYVKQKKYDYSWLVKQSKYREINAIMDLIIGKLCCGVFIGGGGSSFSDTIHIAHKNDVKVVCHFVDLDNILT